MYNASGRIEQKEKDKIEGDPLFRDAWKYFFPLQNFFFYMWLES